MAASALASRRRWLLPAATSRSGAAMPRRTRPPPRPWPAPPARSIAASATSAMRPRSKRRWLRRWSGSAAPTPALPTPASAAAGALPSSPPRRNSGAPHALTPRREEQGPKLFAPNLAGVFHVSQSAARHMTERATSGDPFGRLVATSSLASLFGTARNEHYAATKAAINALCRALAVELARQGVTANAILPGWIRSDMTAGIMANEKFVANVMPRIPMRRFGEPTDFGGIAVYLMSQASSYHSADCFVIDGGYTAF